MERNVAVEFLSHVLTPEGPFFAGRKEFTRTSTRCLHKGDSCNQESWTFSNHVGTHIDCPAHFSDEGKKITDYSAAEWVFSRVFLLDITVEEGQIIFPDTHWEKIPSDCELLLIRTGFEKHRFSECYWSNNPGLSPEVGSWIRKNRPSVKVVGLDFISITAYQNRPLGREAHRAILCPDTHHEGLRVIEDMKLSGLRYAPLSVTVSPVLVSSDGSPVTVFAYLQR